MGNKDNQSIFHNGFWRKPKPVHLCPVYKWTTRANQHHPTDPSQAQTEHLGQQGKALKQNIKCRGFLFMCRVLTCPGCICSSSLQGSCSVSSLTLTLSWPSPLWRLLPGSCCFAFFSDRCLISTSKTPHLELQLPPVQTWLPGKGRGCSTAEADRSSSVLITSLPQTKGTRTNGPRLSGKSLQHPSAAFWLSLRLVPSPIPTGWFSLALTVPSLWQPCETSPYSHWHSPHSEGHIPSISAAHFSAPSPARQQVFWRPIFLK